MTADLLFKYAATEKERHVCMYIHTYRYIFLFIARDDHLQKIPAQNVPSLAQITVAHLLVGSIGFISTSLGEVNKS